MRDLDPEKRGGISFQEYSKVLTLERKEKVV